jgi:hypothetical protein
MDYLHTLQGTSSNGPFINDAEAALARLCGT